MNAPAMYAKLARSRTLEIVTDKPVKVIPSLLDAW